MKMKSFDIDGDAHSDAEAVNDSPIDEVRLTVPTTDDPSLPVLTFRTWILGVISCAVLAFVNQFFSYRQNQLGIGAVVAQIVVLPFGKFLARTLPERAVHIPFTNWSFSLNPGPFNMKEHVLITIFANAGAGGVYAVKLVTIVKVFYHRKLNPIAGMLLAQTTQMFGYGWAGLFRKFLVDSPYMWWPGNLVAVSLFQVLHEKEKRSKGGVTRLQFFTIAFIASFAYYIVPGYFFPSLSAISFVCWIWRNSITAQQIGSGNHGFGIGSFALDYSTASSFLGSPMVSPSFATLNMLVGFILVVYIVIPICYWSNIYEVKRLPLFSSHVFDYNGKDYNISRILNQQNFELDRVGYDNYSKIYMSIFFVFCYGSSFATLTATISHVGLFYGKTIWTLWKSATNTVQDVHTKLMKKNYEEVPQWWFQAILVAVLALSLYACLGFDRQLQLPWWGLLLACAMAFVFTLPVGIITATTNQQLGLNVITEMVIGFMLPGKPLANVTFKTYGYVSMAQALTFLADFKLGHYMKIPPKAMFLAQLAGTAIASTVSFLTTWWMIGGVNNLCDASIVGNPWSCPSYDVFYNASIIWGVVGPLRMFTNYGVYPELNYFFLIGFLSPFPVWWLSRRYPNKKWITLINMPIILGSWGAMPAARAVNYIMWFIVALYFNFYVYYKHRQWWAQNNYVLAAALDAGIVFLGVLIYFTLQNNGISGPNFWGSVADDHCSLAKCPTAPGIEVKGCPVV